MLSAGRKAGTPPKHQNTSRRSGEKEEPELRHWQGAGHCGGQDRKGRGGSEHAQSRALMVLSLADPLCLPWNMVLVLWGSLMKTVVSSSLYPQMHMQIILEVR